MTSDLPAATLAGARLDRYFHACAFVNGRAEAFSSLVPFMCEGVALGEKVVEVTDEASIDEHRQLLADAGMDLSATEASRQLEVIAWAEAYLKDGRFDPDDMLVRLEGILTAAREHGFPRTRVVGFMEWALEDRPGVERLFEYEARVNYVLAAHRQPAVCTYDATRFPGHFLLDVLRTHPLVIVNGILHENPFFVPPDQFLQELKRRQPLATAV